VDERQGVRETSVEDRAGRLLVEQKLVSELRWVVADLERLVDQRSIIR
jgi:hypothetical protein